VSHTNSPKLISPVIVFLPTARAAALFHDVFATMHLPYPVWEIHSRMSQSKRTSTTEEFRKAARGVLFSSDVTARGIDIKEVSAVMQIGLPSSADQCESRPHDAMMHLADSSRRTPLGPDCTSRSRGSRYPHPRRVREPFPPRQDHPVLQPPSVPPNRLISFPLRRRTRSHHRPPRSQSPGLPGMARILQFAHEIDEVDTNGSGEPCE